MFNISPMQLIIVLIIVVLLFGTKKLRSLGGDLGSALKGFKKAIHDEDKEKDADFVAKEKVEDKSTDSAGEAVNSAEQTKSQQKESN